MDKLLQEVQSLTADEMRRLRRAIDEQLAESEPAVSGNGNAQLQALSWLRKELAALPSRPNATLVPTMRKPFDALAEGLFVQSSGAEGI